MYLTYAILHVILVAQYPIKWLTCKGNHTMLVTQSSTHSICHTMLVMNFCHANKTLVTQRLLCHTIQWLPNPSDQQCWTLYRTHLFSILSSLGLSFSLLLLSFCLVFILALFGMYRAFSIAGCFKSPVQMVTKISLISLSIQNKFSSLLFIILHTPCWESLTFGQDIYYCYWSRTSVLDLPWLELLQ